MRLRNRNKFIEIDTLEKLMKTAILLLIVLAACAQEVQVHNLSPQQAKELLDSKEELNLFVLNVHTPYEGKLEGTDTIIEDWEHISAHHDQLPKNKQTPILAYCRSGRMSISAVEQLKKLGYTNIYHLDGGMRAWSAASFSVVDKKFE